MESAGWIVSTTYTVFPHLDEKEFRNASSFKILYTLQLTDLYKDLYVGCS